MFASDLGKAFFAELNAADLQILKAALLKEGKYTSEQICTLVGASHLRRYKPDTVQLARSVCAVTKKYQSSVDIVITETCIGTPACLAAWWICILRCSSKQTHCLDPVDIVHAVICLDHAAAQ